jgi:arginyl-tRNA synthetase
MEAEQCPQGMNGDITLNCFRNAKILRQPPDKIAEAALNFMLEHPDVEKAEKIKAFVNITLTPEALFRNTVQDIEKLLAAPELPENQKKKILIEYSAPNTNKPQHLGHVRNNTLGMSLASLLERVGHDVTPVNLVNDRGIHICKSMIAYQRFGNDTTPQSEGIKGDHFVGNYYVRYNEELTRQLATLREEKPSETEGKSDEDLFLETEIGQATQKMLQDWENNVEEVRQLWQKMNAWVFEGFEETYKRMGVRFARTYLESDTYLLGKDVVMDGLEKGIFAKRDDGAVFVDLGKMGQKIILRSDGTSVYITQDIGTTIKKYEDYAPESQIWVVGDEQILHFKMLFEIIKKMGYEWAENLFHLAYGMVNLPSGKMKSREGTVVDADDLFDEMVSLAKTATLERCGDNPPEDIDERSEIIGMGALKFMLLKFNPKTTIMFDPQASVKFEGDTGPYVQYACARINSIERKSAERGIVIEKENINWSLLKTQEEKNLAVSAFFYPSILRIAAEKMDCSGLVNYLLELAKTFSRFYRECPVLNAKNEDLRNARLALCFKSRDILADGLKTLTIDIPRAM